MTGYFFPVYYIRHLSQEKLTHFYKFYGDFFMKSFIPLNSIYITLLAELEDAIIENSNDTLIAILLKRINDLIYYIGYDFLYPDSEIPYSFLKENEIIKVMTLASFLNLLQTDGEYCPETGDIILFKNRKNCFLFMRHMPQRLQQDMREYGYCAIASVSAEEVNDFLYYKDYYVIDSDEHSTDPLIAWDTLAENQFVLQMPLSSLERFYHKYYFFGKPRFVQ